MTVALASTLDTAAAGPLRLALRQELQRGQALVLDGGAVERIGQACLQVLVAGQADAARTGIDFRIEPASPAFIEMATTAGLPSLVTA